MTINSTIALTKWYRPNCCQDDPKRPFFFFKFESATCWKKTGIFVHGASQQMFRPFLLSRTLSFRVYLVAILKTLIMIIMTLVVKYQFWVYKITVMFIVCLKMTRLKGFLWIFLKWHMYSVRSLVNKPFLHFEKYKNFC